MTRSDWTYLAAAGGSFVGMLAGAVVGLSGVAWWAVAAALGLLFGGLSVVMQQRARTTSLPQPNVWTTLCTLAAMALIYAVGLRVFNVEYGPNPPAVTSLLLCLAPVPAIARSLGRLVRKSHGED
jgi:hypothetical protein